MKNLIKKHYKKLLGLALSAYVLCIFVSQQNTLNTYNKEISTYTEQKTEQEEVKETLTEMKENVNSEEYIEKIAREKLGMYLPNEKVYIDVTK